MKKELELELVQLAPNLYIDYLSKDFSKSLMGFGFCCPDEWFKILKNLSVDLEKEILFLPASERSNYKAAQVKEKFDSLRFYMSSETDKMSKLIAKAENKISKLGVENDL